MKTVPIGEIPYTHCAAHVVKAISDMDSPEPANRLACRKALAEVNELLKGLPSKQREALLLNRVEGLSHREVADSLDGTTSAVKSLVFRATARLRRELAEIL